MSYQSAAAAAKLANFAFPFSHRWKLDAFGSRRRLLLLRWAGASSELPSASSSPPPFDTRKFVKASAGRKIPFDDAQTLRSLYLCQPNEATWLSFGEERRRSKKEEVTFPFGLTAAAEARRRLTSRKGLSLPLLLPACLSSLSCGPLITNRGSNFCRRSPPPKGTASAAG